MPVPAHTTYYLEIVSGDVEGALRLYTAMHDQENPIVRSYLRVTDIESAVKLAADLGAVIALPPMDMPGAGKIAIFQHGGIDQGLWQIP